MASPITSTGQIAGPVDVVFQETLLRNAESVCPYYVGSMPAEIQAHSGSFTAKWRRIENLEPVDTPLAELTGNLSHPTRDAVQPQVTDLTEPVQKYGNHILLNEEADLVNFNGQADKLAEILGINAGQSLNRLQRDEMEDNSPIIYANGAANDGAVSDALSINDIRNAVNQIHRNDGLKFTPNTFGDVRYATSPLRKSYWGICHPDVEEDIRAMANFIDVVQYGGHTATEEGEIGSVGGARFISTSDAGIDEGAGGVDAQLRPGGGNIDLYSTVIFGMEAVGSLGFDRSHVKRVYMAGDKLPSVMMINKAFGSSGVTDPYNELSTLAWKSWHGAKVLNSNWIRSIRSGATQL